MDSRLPHGTNYCKCPGCGEYFNSVLSFDKHRRGKPTERRCLTPEEMYGKGMVKNAKDYWVSKAHQIDPYYRPTTQITHD